VPALVTSLILPVDAGGQVPKAPLADSARGQVLVLGTMHLSALGKSFNPNRLSTLLARLEAWQPDVIAVEAMPPEEIERLDLLARETADTAAAEILDAFAGNVLEQAQSIRAELGLERRADAERAVTELLRGGAMEPADRRRATALLLAAFDEPSAVLQWSYLGEGERRPDDGVTSGAAAALDARLAAPNENWELAAALARRLGHQRLASIDDHVDDEVGLRSGLYDGLQEELSAAPAFQAFIASPSARAQAAMMDSARTADDLWPFYVTMNSAASTTRDVEGQWHLFYRTALPSGADRRRVALWEQRNLNIAGRIRAAADPTGRTMVVIGAAHKPFLDAYLGETMDLQVVSLEAIDDRR
jgi:hypothetical protein